MGASTSLEDTSMGGVWWRQLPALPMHSSNCLYCHVLVITGRFNPPRITKAMHHLVVLTQIEVLFFVLFWGEWIVLLFYLSPSKREISIIGQFDEKAQPCFFRGPSPNVWATLLSSPMAELW